MSYPPKHFVTRLEGAPCPCRECIHKTCTGGPDGLDQTVARSRRPRPGWGAVARHTCSELMEAERAWHMWETAAREAERRLMEVLARAAWAENLLAAALSEDKRAGVGPDNSGELGVGPGDRPVVIDWRPDAEALLASETDISTKQTAGP